METVPQKKRSHRSRFVPQPKKQRLAVTENRLQIIEFLSRYGSLPTKSILDLYGAANGIKDPGAAQDALTDMYHERQNLDVSRQIILRPDDVNRNGQDTIHVLGAAGYTEYLRRSAAWCRKKQVGPSRYMPHDRHLCIIMASIEAAIRRDADLRFISHIEILDYYKCSEAARTTPQRVSLPSVSGFLEPDALFGFHDTRSDAYKFFALELDRSEETLTGKIQKKIDGYTHILSTKAYASYLGVPNLRVLWLAPSRERCDNIQARIKTFPDAHFFHEMEKYNGAKNPPPPYRALFADAWRTPHGPAFLKGGDTRGHRTHEALDRAA